MNKPNKKLLTRIKKDIHWEHGYEQGFKDGIIFANKRLFNVSKNPSCLNCGTDFVNAVDSKTKKVSKYLWMPNCDCINKKLRLSIG